MRAQWPPKRRRMSRPPTEAEIILMNKVREFVRSIAPNISETDSNIVVKRIYKDLRRAMIQSGLKRRQ